MSRPANRPAKSTAPPTPPVAATPELALPLIAPPWLRLLIVLLSAALLFVWFSTEVADSDTWWHLKTGQYILEYGLPVPDPFSFTTATAGSAYPGEETVRHFNLTHEWLSQIIFYLVYAAGGFTGMVIFRALLMLGVCALVGLLAWRRSSHFYLAVAASIATGCIAIRFLSDRPFLFSFILMAGTLALLEYRRWLWALPAISLFWANCHGGFFLMWGLMGAYCVEAAVDRYRGKPQPGERQLYLITAVAILISGLNPNFFQPVLMPLSYSHSVIQSTILEWQHTAFWPLEPFQVMLFLTLGILLWARRSVRLVDWIMFLTFALAARWAVRNVMFFGIIAPPIIAAYFPWKRVLPAIAQFAAAGLLVLGIGLGVSTGTGLQFHAAEWKYSWGAAKFLQDHQVQSRMLNSYVQGGFWIWRLWPQEKDFIDGRALSDNVYKDYRSMVYNMAGSDPREILAKYGIETIVLDGFDYASGEVFRLVPVLGLSTPVQWHLVYWDATTTIFMLHPPPDVQPIPNGFAINAIEAQCQNYMAHDAFHTRCAFGLGNLYMQLKDNTLARKWFALYLNSTDNPDPEAKAIYARLLASGK